MRYVPYLFFICFSIANQVFATCPEINAYTLADIIDAAGESAWNNGLMEKANHFVNEQIGKSSVDRRHAIVDAAFKESTALGIIVKDSDVHALPIATLTRPQVAHLVRFIGALNAAAAEFVVSFKDPESLNVWTKQNTPFTTTYKVLSVDVVTGLFLFLPSRNYGGFSTTPLERFISVIGATEAETGAPRNVEAAKEKFVRYFRLLNAI